MDQMELPGTIRLNKIGLKACTKCRGDLFWQYDEYGAYQSCLQCGNIARDLAGLTLKNIGKYTAKESMPRTQ